jgi:hypothetical protein
MLAGIELSGVQRLVDDELLRSRLRHALGGHDVLELQDRELLARTAGATERERFADLREVGQEWRHQRDDGLPGRRGPGHQPGGRP